MITPAQIQAGFTSINTIIAELETVETAFSMVMPANVKAAFDTMRAFQPAMMSVESTIIDVVTKIEAAMAPAA